jgi:hypothetical protein
MRMTGSRKTFEAHGQRCIACGVSGASLVTWHHEASQKSFPQHKNNPRVLFPVCLTHHNQRHTIGQSAFIEKFPQYAKALEEKGWVYCELKRVWKFPEG